MKLTCTGRKVSLKDAFVERTEKRFRKMDKLFSELAEAQVTVTVEKEWQTVEITVRDKGLTCRAEKSADRMEEALDAAADVLERRVLKNRKRLNLYGEEPVRENTEWDEEDLEGEPYHIIREKHFFVKPSTVDEAILEMNLLGHSFYMFRDADTDDIHVVYARKDGSYGLLVPER